MFIGPFGSRFITDITMIEIGREKGEAKEAVLHHEFLLEIGRDLINFFTAYEVRSLSQFHNLTQRTEPNCGTQIGEDNGEYGWRSDTCLETDAFALKLLGFSLGREQGYLSLTNGRPSHVTSAMVRPHQNALPYAEHI